VSMFNIPHAVQTAYRWRSEQRLRLRKVPRRGTSSRRHPGLEVADAFAAGSAAEFRTASRRWLDYFAHFPVSEAGREAKRRRLQTWAPDRRPRKGRRRPRGERERKDLSRTLVRSGAAVTPQLRPGPQRWPGRSGPRSC
jgi:hypothetical protein